MQISSGSPKFAVHVGASDLRQDLSKHVCRESTRLQIFSSYHEQPGMASERVRSESAVSYLSSH
jgi:hypothetical protein